MTSVIRFDYVSVLLHDAERDVMRLHLWPTPDEDLLRPGWEGPVEGTAAGWVWQTQQPAITHDIARAISPATPPRARSPSLKSLTDR